MPHLVHEGVRLNYRDAGRRDRPAVVLVHGLAANQAFWSLELVAALADTWRVVTYDLRGHGYSDSPPAGYDPASQAGDLQALLDHLDLPAANLVGHSYGGLVALQLAIDAPRRVRSLVLADSRLAGLAPQQVLPQQPDWPDLRARLIRSGVQLVDDEPEIGLCLLDAIAGPRWAGARRRAQQHVRFVPFAGSKRSAAHWLKLMRTTRAAVEFREHGRVRPQAVAALQAPILAVYGDRSPHRASMLALAASAPHVQTATVADGGHFHPAAEPLRFAAVLGAFLAAQGTISSGPGELL